MSTASILSTGKGFPAVLVVALTGAVVAIMAFGTSAALTHSDVDQIRSTLNAGCRAFIAGDAKGMMAPFRNDGQLVVFDLTPPRSKSYGDLDRDNRAMKDLLEGPVQCEYLEIHPFMLAKDLAYSISIMHAGGQLKGGKRLDFTIRSTDIWRKMGSRWYSIHEHNSFPVDVLSGQADLQSKP